MTSDAEPAFMIPPIVCIQDVPVVSNFTDVVNISEGEEIDELCESDTSELEEGKLKIHVPLEPSLQLLQPLSMSSISLSGSFSTTVEKPFDTIRRRWIDGLAESREIDSMNKGLSLGWKKSKTLENLSFMIYICHGLPEERRIPSGNKENVEEWIKQKSRLAQPFVLNIDLAIQTLADLAPRLHEQFLRNNKKKNNVQPIEIIFFGVIIYILQAVPGSNTPRVKTLEICNLRATIHGKIKHLKKKQDTEDVGMAFWKAIEPIATKFKASPVLKRKADGKENVDPALKRVRFNEHGNKIMVMSPASKPSSPKKRTIKKHQNCLENDKSSAALKTPGSKKTMVSHYITKSSTASKATGSGPSSSRNR